MTRAAWLASLVVLGACGVREEGISVDVSLRVTPSSDAALAFTTATLAVEQLELIPCEETTWWRALAPVSTAWAHGDAPEGSPWLLRARTVIDLTSAAPLTLGTLHPPPGTVCALRVTFAPSTADSPSQGTTLLLEGTVAGSPLRQLSTKRLLISLAFDGEPLDGARLALPLSLGLSVAPPGLTGDQSLEATLSSMTLAR